MLFKTAMRQRLLMLVACIMLGTASARAVDFYTFAIWDETTGTLYFDCDIEIPTVGSTWTTSQNETITVSKIWSGDQVLNIGKSSPGWHSYDVKSACTRVVFGNMMDSPTSCDSWFGGFENLTTVEGLSNLKTENVTRMDMMFWRCSKLTSLNLTGFDTQKVETMSWMFSGCSSLTTLNLSTFNTSKVLLMQEMFSYCTNLKTIYVDANSWSTKSVINSTGMFSGCTSLVGGNGTVYDSENTGVDYARVDKSRAPGYLTDGVLYAMWDESSHELSFGFGKIDNPNFTKLWIGMDVIKVSWRYDVWTKCTKLIFTNSFATNMKEVDMSGWFAYFTSLETVDGFEDVTPGRNTNQMFIYCKKLTSISLPSTLNRIGFGMFYNCACLTNMFIPAGVTSIVEEAFVGCTSLSAFTVSKDNTHFMAEDGVLLKEKKKELVAYPAGKTDEEYAFPNGVTTVREYAFYNLKHLSSVSLPSSMTAVGDGAFLSCSISSVKVSAKNPPILGARAFEEIANGATLYVTKGCKSAYEASDWNLYFKNIEEFGMLPGDANGDGKVDAQDIVGITNYIAGVASGNFYEDAADINGDGEVNIADIVAIAKLILSE